MESPVVPEGPRDNLTPMLRQYHAVKADHADAILMFRMGDFYEMFFEDAVTASKALDIALTARGKGTANAAPMCGVPYAAVDQYVARLVKQGFKVALCDQVEEPSRTKKLVRREVVRVITPGTVTDPAQLEARAPSWICSVYPAGDRIGLAFADLSTGDFRLTEIPSDRAAEDLGETIAQYGPREIIHPEAAEIPMLSPCGGSAPASLTPRPPWSFSPETAGRSLCTHLGVASLAGYGIENRPAAVGAAGALMGYLQETQRTSLSHLDGIRYFERSGSLVMDESTRRNLELVRSLADGQVRGSLLWVIDRTVTAMGGRLLREWLLSPLVEREPIERRLDSVEALVRDDRARGGLQQSLGEVRDIERLLTRAVIGTAGPRDLGSLRGSIEALPAIVAAAEAARSPAIDAVRSQIEDLSGLGGLLRRALADELPTNLKDGGIVRDGYDSEVDEARGLTRDGKSTLAALETRERKRTGIGSLKVRYNRVFGYYIEVSKANLSSVPADYERRQTLVGGERFTTPELRDYETRILTAEDRLGERERGIFLALRDEVVGLASAIRRTSAAVATLDALSSLAEAACEGRSAWTRPVLRDDTRLEIRAGRHPVVERLLTGAAFVPNDLLLDGPGPQIAIVTGPNMGGKSTYLRQTALIVILAQMGSFVPAESAGVGVVDRVFSRVGASDNLAGGQSTFMVEMSETANILHSATPRSLVVLDEVGRGTSTFDGLSLAWAVVEFLHDLPDVAARTLFATHYHELTDLAMTLERVTNLHISAREYRGDVVFLHRVEPGAADQSYGIQVARLAGIPTPVIERAREILGTLERNEFGPEGMPKLARRGRSDRRQMPLFIPAGEAAHPGPGDEATHPAIELLRESDPERMTPIEALNLVVRMRKLVDEP